VDVRVVSATNRDLREAIGRGQFREELFDRVNVIAITLPPLRERRGDVPLLVNAFLRKYGQGRVHAVEDAAMEALEAYAWPGNVRELQNVVERACALAEGATITRQDLPDSVLRREPRVGGPSPDAVPGGLAAALSTGSDLPLKDARALAAVLGSVPQI
jgi:two-component system response regulator AtoC